MPNIIGESFLFTNRTYNFVFGFYITRLNEEILFLVDGHNGGGTLEAGVVIALEIDWLGGSGFADRALRKLHLTTI